MTPPRKTAGMIISVENFETNASPKNKIEKKNQIKLPFPLKNFFRYMENAASADIDKVDAIKSVVTREA